MPTLLRRLLLVSPGILALIARAGLAAAQSPVAPSAGPPAAATGDPPGGARLPDLPAPPDAPPPPVEPPGPSLPSGAPSPSAEPFAPPPPAAPFGAKGQWVILATSTSAGISSETFSGSAANFFDANIEIGVDRFVARNFSMGLDAEATYDDNKGYGATSLNETKSTQFAGGVRVGLNVPLGRLVSWYPRLTLGLSSSHSDTQTLSVFSLGAAPAPPVSTSTLGPWINVYAPLLVHPVPHLFMGVGPRFERNFGEISGGPYDGSQTTLLSVDFVVGGWWGGPEEQGTPPEAGPHARRFGDRGEVVVTSAATASVASAGYSRSTASASSVDLEPGVDYFVIDRLSLGLGVSLGYGSETSFDSGGQEVDFTESSFGIAPRIGLDLAISGDLSLWPQIEIGAGFSTSHATAAAGSNDHEKGRTWLQASVPLLVHATTHFFLGAGPFAYTELSDSDQNHVENDATTVGASFVLGGWL